MKINYELGTMAWVHLEFDWNGKRSHRLLYVEQHIAFHHKKFVLVNPLQTGILAPECGAYSTSGSARWLVGACRLNA